MSKLYAFFQRRGLYYYTDTSPERYNQTDESELRLHDLEFSTIYKVWVRYFIENYENIYNYNQTISDVILKFKTSCEGR